jgi:dienelactone hydrolase
LKRFAQATADQGLPCLRFDYDGTGDSFGSDFDPERLQAWVTSIHQAIDALKTKTAVDRVVLLGVRLGATLAALAAAERTDVIGLVAIAPVLAGKAYLRELRALQMALDLLPAPVTVSGLPEGIQESVGFAISAETQQQLAQIDLTQQTRAPVHQVLLLDRLDLEPNTAWVAHLRNLGATVTHHRLPGYVEMVLDPHKAQVPAAMLEATLTWLGQHASEASATAVGVNPVTKSPNRVELFHETTFSMSAELPVAGVETFGFIDADSILFGVTTRPVPQVSSPQRRLGILLLTAGAIHHVGPNRLHVTLARRWAREGHVVLRLDVSGIGDSRTRAGELENVVYGHRASDDVTVALRYLRAQPEVARVMVVGLCSGAYHGLKSAVAGEAIDALVPINPVTFFWKDGMSLDYPAHIVASESHRYAQSIFKLASWMKLLRGHVHVAAFLQLIFRRLLSLIEHHLRNFARRIGRPLAHDLGIELELIAAHGIRIDFLFAEGDPGIDLLRLQGGSTIRRLRAQNCLQVHVIDGPDHTFTPMWSHAPLIDRLTSIINAQQQN